MMVSMTYLRGLEIAELEESDMPSSFKDIISELKFE
jgi:hypothetical protein